MHATLLRFLPSLLVLCLCSACGDDSASPCDVITCDDWEECVAGSCEPLPGLCGNYTHCPEDMFCAEDHTCQGPVGPEEGFMEPLFSECVVFEYRGLINSYEDLASSHVTLGSGDFAYYSSTMDPLRLDESAYVYRYRVPHDYHLPELRGVELMIMGVSHQVEGTMADVEYYNISAGFPVEGFLAMMEEELFQGPLIDPMWFTVRRVWIHVREWDRTQFRKYCEIAGRKTESSESKIFLSFFDNVELTPGENLLLWGNIVLTDPVEITEQNEEEHCVFYQGSTPITRQQYLDGISLTGPTISCEIPDGFFDAATTRNATMLFSGLINDPANQSFEYGYGVLEIDLDGTEIVADDYYALSYRWTQGQTDLLVHQTLGSVEVLGQDHYSFYMVQSIIDPEVLTEMKNGGIRTIPYDPSSMFFQLEWMEEKIRGDDIWYRSCPAAVSDPQSQSGSLLACHEQNVTFAPGERLEIAANIDLTDDAATLHDVFGMTEDCYCYRNTTTQLVDCTEFEAQ